MPIIRCTAILARRGSPRGASASRALLVHKSNSSSAAMAALGPGESKEDIQKKIEETREKFRCNYAQDSIDKYEASDLERLWQDDSLVDGYLEWRHYIVEDALKMIDESFQWRKELGVNDIQESNIQKSLLELGMHYLHGYDREGHQLFWFKVGLHTRDVRLLLDKKRYAAFWLERHVRRQPDQQLTVVFDMSDAGLSNVDMEFVKFIINCFEVYYPRLLYRMIIYELPWILNAAWKIVKSWLSPDAVSVLKFVSKSDIQTLIAPDQLPAYMGGTDPFTYSYPPLPDAHLQLLGEEPDQEDQSETEEIEEQSEENAEALLTPKKVCFADELETGPPRTLAGPVVRTSGGTFKGSLLHISPAEELSFGQRECERRCQITLSNLTTSAVAFKVRTTAPAKYRVKPSSSVCAAGTSMEITVSLHGDTVSSVQDRFLILGAEMEPSVTEGNQDLAQFWKELPRSKVMEHRLKCHVLQGLKPALSPAPSPAISPAPKTHNRPASANGTSAPPGVPSEECSTVQQEKHPTRVCGTSSLKIDGIKVEDVTEQMFRQVMTSCRRLDQKLDHCLWTQRMLVVMVTVVATLAASTFFTLLFAGDRPP